LIAENNQGVASVLWLWIALGIVLGVPALLALSLFVLWIYLRVTYGPQLIRIFQEKPLFIIPRGQPVEGADDVRFQTADGLELRGCYLRTPSAQRRGVILFGIEFGSNRWSAVPYCEHLLTNGFDVFAFETRGQGDSPIQPNYEPSQWVTNFEVADAEAALGYLKSRPDADPRGVGFFGISKGGGAGLLAAARDPYVRCCVTDGIFATFTTVVPYMRKWISIYNKSYFIQHVLPAWYYELVGRACVGRMARKLGFHLPDLEKAMPKLAPRPLLMIHGGGDTYIKPEMAQALFNRARAPKEIWIVEGAKHNQALHVAGEQYRSRVLEFFQRHLASPDSTVGANGKKAKATPSDDEHEPAPRVTSTRA
jgi:fermentation-respiration switch protein FrsA (DUF1100 family)